MMVLERGVAQAVCQETTEFAKTPGRKRHAPNAVLMLHERAVQTMTDNEIIKALECCARSEEDCTQDCPLWLNDESCFSYLLKPILDLINRQKAEIERLKGWQDLLKAEKHSLIEVEAIKKFAKKFKAKSVVWRIDNYDMGYQITDDEFDDLVKEMVGD